MRVLLILVDGMRPDSLTDIQKAQEIIKKIGRLLMRLLTNDCV